MHGALACRILLREIQVSNQSMITCSSSKKKKRKKKHRKTNQQTNKKEENGRKVDDDNDDLVAVVSLIIFCAVLNFLFLSTIIIAQLRTYEGEERILLKLHSERRHDRFCPSSSGYHQLTQSAIFSTSTWNHHQHCALELSSYIRALCHVVRVSSHS